MKRRAAKPADPCLVGPGRPGAAPIALSLRPVNIEFVIEVGPDAEPSPTPSLAPSRSPATQFLSGSAKPPLDNNSNNPQDAYLRANGSPFYVGSTPTLPSKPSQRFFGTRGSSLK